MARLLSFSPDDHVYEVDGEIIPSVSEVIRFITREIYTEVDQATLDRAADRGTRAHKATEVLDKYGEVDCDDDIIPYVTAYINFRAEHGCEWDKIEWSGYDPERKVAGTIDRCGIIDGKVTILDVKTTYTVHKQAVTAQLTLYKMICESCGINVDKLAVLQLKKDGDYKLIYIDERRDVAEACLTLHRLMEKKRRKKSGTGKTEGC